MFVGSKVSMRFVSILEQQWRKLAQTAPPRQPLMRRVGRFVEYGVDARGFKRGRVLPGIAAEAAPGNPVGAEFATAIADEHELHLFLELGHVGDVRHRDAAAAEDADV